MKIVCQIDHAITQKACLIVNSYYNNSEFLEIVGANTFNLADPKEVTTRLYFTTANFTVRPYTTWNPWSNVIGHYANNVCFLNTRKLNRPLEDVVETIFHELLGHGLGYRHEGNRVTSFNLGTWPYKGASLFIKFLKSKGIL